MKPHSSQEKTNGCLPRAVALLLQAGGIEFGLMSQQWCCGGPMWETGFLDVAHAMAEHNMLDWRKNGPTRIVCPDPHDYLTIVEHYPELDERFDEFEIVLALDLIAELVREGKIELTTPVERTVTYHDPCRLNQRRGVWQSPRELLRAIPGLNSRGRRPRHAVVVLLRRRLEPVRREARADGGDQPSAPGQGERLVAGAAQRALVIADMPFLSYQVSVEEAVRNAGRLIQAGAAAVKLEGGAAVVDRVQAMTRFGIPVMGHLGMTPQYVHQYGGYRVQGKERPQAETLLSDAKALEAAGAFAIVLEAIPAELAGTVTGSLAIPTIGIGAGARCDGQVLVLYDLLGLFDDFAPKFLKPYAHLKADALQALRRYKEEVEQGKYPSDSESYH